MTTIVMSLIIFEVVFFVAVCWLWMTENRALSRLYQEMETMTPRDAYRRGLVLKYLPQCQIDMDEIDAMVNKKYQEAKP